MRYSGQATPHECARGHVTGQAVYAEDLLPRYPRTLHAHAPVLEEPGVVTTLTAADVAAGHKSRLEVAA